MEIPPLWLYLTTMGALFILNVVVAVFTLRQSARMAVGFWGWLCVVGALLALDGFLTALVSSGNRWHSMVLAVQDLAVVASLALLVSFIVAWAREAGAQRKLGRQNRRMFETKPIYAKLGFMYTLLAGMLANNGITRESGGVQTVAALAIVVLSLPVLLAGLTGRFPPSEGSREGDSPRTALR